MGKNGVENYQPDCLLAHDLINKLTTIVGACELLQDKAEDDPECMRRLLTIQETAKSIAKDLQEHQCHLEDAVRKQLITRRDISQAETGENAEARA